MTWLIKKARYFQNLNFSFYFFFFWNVPLNFFFFFYSKQNEENPVALALAMIPVRHLRNSCSKGSVYQDLHDWWFWGKGVLVFLMLRDSSKPLQLSSEGTWILLNSWVCEFEAGVIYTMCPLGLGLTKAKMECKKCGCLSACKNTHRTTLKHRNIRLFVWLLPT